MTTLIEFLSLSDPNVRFVVLGMILLGISSGVVGCFTLLRKRALLGDAIAHSVLPGVCLAFVLFDSKNPFILLAGACVTGWLSLLVIDFVTTRSRIKSDAAIGLTLSVFFGVGILILTAIQKTGNASQSGLDKFLFGKAAAMIGGDVWVFGGLSIVLILIVIAFYKEFTLLSFDLQFAQVIGLPVRLLEVLLATITVLAVATGIQAVGVVLMAALLITPAAAARYWTDKLSIMLVLSAIFGAVGGIFGAYISYLAPRMPTGPWVVVVLSVIAFVSILFAPRKGLLGRYWHHRNNQLQILEENILKIFFHLGETENNFFAQRNLTDLQNRRQIPARSLESGIHRLLGKNFIQKNKNNTWQLTEAGKQKASRQVRLHRLWELYLSQYLRIAPDHVHDDAEAIEHIITPELEAQLQAMLDFPKKDPHDKKIPY